MVSNMQNFISADMLNSDDSDEDHKSQDSDRMRRRNGGRNNNHRDGSPEDSNGGKTISQRQVRKMLDKNLLDLDLVSCNLSNWDNLMPLAPKMVDLLKVDLSKNNLVNIDFLSQLQQLRSVICCDNYLQSIHLELNHLEQLDLRNNFIQVMPALSLMPKLKRIFINANNIKELRLVVNQNNFNYLNKIVVKNNKIEFDAEQLSRFIKKLKQFKVLRTISLENNPFMKNPMITQQILKNLPESTDMFNNSRLAFAQSCNEDAVKHAAQDAAGQELDKKTAREVDLQIKQAMAEEGPEEKVHKKKPKLMPTLETMVYGLDMATNYPTKTLTCIKQLYVDTEVVINQQMCSIRQEDFDKQFLASNLPRAGPEEEKEKLTINIEKFMQFTQMVIDNHSDVRKIILSILSKLTIIHTAEFGVRCFYTLWDLMRADQDLEVLVREQIDINIVQQLNRRPPKHIHYNILHGLIELVSDTELCESKLMRQLFKDFFPKWLSEFKENLIFQKNIPQFKIKQTDAILALLTVSLRDDKDNVECMIEMGLHLEVAEIFTKTPPTASRYLHLLQNLTEISKLSQQAAADFVDRFVHSELIQDVKLSFYQYKKSYDFKTDNIEQKVLQYRVFSAQIELIASLLNAGGKQQDIIMWDGLVIDLMGVINNLKADPQLLYSVCYLTHQVFTNEKINKEKSELEQRLFKTQYCENLLQYLPDDGTKFLDMIADVQKYDLDNEFEIDDPDQETISMETFDNPIIHKLFIQIVKIITFFSSKYIELITEKGGKVSNPDEEKIMQLYEKTADKMDEAGREDKLFQVLLIPNDDVKLAVVHALTNVPLEQYDSKEMSSLIGIVESYQNIGTGKTEIVLSILFHIFASFVGDQAERNEATVSAFKSLYGEKSIDLALMLMNRNQCRIVKEEDEEKEKYILAISILNFLFFVSKDSVLQVYLEKQAMSTGAFKSILFSEQAFTCNDAFVKVPLLLEDTSIGIKFDNLKSVVSQGFQCLSPYNYVSFRVLSSIANLLSLEKSKEDLEPLKLSDLKGEDFDDTLLDTYAKSLQVKITNEKDIWSDFNRARNDELMEGMDVENSKFFKEQHENFTKKNGLQTLLHFLTSQANEVENWLRMNNDPSLLHAGSPNTHPIFGLGLEFQIEAKKRTLNEQIIEYDYMEEFKAKDDHFLKKAKPHHGIESNKQLAMQEKHMLSKFRSAQLGIGYQPSSTELFLASRKVPRVVKRLQFREASKMGIQNPEQRSLSIAAFLRCIKVSIESAPDDQFYEEALGNIRSDKIFSQVSQLCATSGWVDANIGSKYMQLMRYVFRMDTTLRLEDNDRIYKYEVLSIVIRRILGLMERKIVNENGNDALSNNEILLLCHLMGICHLIASQCILFDFMGYQEMDSYRLENKHQKATRLELVAFIMQKLFPMTTVRQIIDIVFMEMQRSLTYVHGLAKANNQTIHGQAKANNQTRLDQLLYSSTIRTTESTKKFLSIFVAFQPELKYEVIQYIMTNVCFSMKAIRVSFLQEVLEGANQMALSEHQLFTLTEFDSNNIFEVELKTVSYHHSREIEYLKHGKEEMIENLQKSPSREKWQQEVDFMDGVLSNLRNDKFLGERIVFNQPLLVHIKVQDERKRSMGMYYKVYNVILTNHGVYIIDDDYDSFNQDPSDIQKQPMPDRILRFSYKSIKFMSYAHRVEQRIVIKVERDLLTYEPNWWHVDEDMSKSSRRTRGTTHKTNQRNATGETMQTVRKSNRTSKNTTQNDDTEDDPVSETLFITFVVPNHIDSLAMREIFEEALQQSKSNFEDGEKDKKLALSYLTHNAIIIKMRTFLNIYPSKGETGRIDKAICPICGQNRKRYDCDCDHFIVYCYRLKHEKTLRLFNKSRQRGGPIRLLSTELIRHRENTRSEFSMIDNEDDPLDTDKSEQDQPELGMLVITPQYIFFAKENPERWEDHTEKINPNQFQELIDPSVANNNNNNNAQQQNSTTPSYSRIKTEISAKGGLQQNQQSGIQDYVTITDKADRTYMSEISSLRIINGKVPTLELEILNGLFATESTYYSMISDCNTQETLLQLKRLKKLGKKLKANQAADKTKK